MSLKRKFGKRLYSCKKQKNRNSYICTPVKKQKRKVKRSVKRAARKNHRKNPKRVAAARAAWARRKGRAQWRAAAAVVGDRDEAEFITVSGLGGHHRRRRLHRRR